MAAFGVGRGCCTLKSFPYIHELTFERVQFGKLLLDRAQLLGHKALQPRPHRCATFPLEPGCQVSELREGVDLKTGHVE
jgi:hypothetical protein